MDPGNQIQGKEQEKASPWEKNHRGNGDLEMIRLAELAKSSRNIPCRNAYPLLRPARGIKTEILTFKLVASINYDDLIILLDRDERATL